ncbi:hypothetical protein EVAR_92888_1 [Eumeta japonica]|uniref:Uncharacterized protein n=1 Tax=Eumeta variegata TaxID=151549 RepID=A0A4C1TA43_EUMVA|nr:hypothetical protein EVAR_92888_1 [Eumeta japonica]
MTISNSGGFSAGDFSAELHGILMIEGSYVQIPYVRLRALPARGRTRPPDRVETKLRPERNDPPKRDSPEKNTVSCVQCVRRRNLYFGGNQLTRRTSIAGRYHGSAAGA